MSLRGEVGLVRFMEEDRVCEREGFMMLSVGYLAESGKSFRGSFSCKGQKPQLVSWYGVRGERACRKRKK